MSSVRSRSPAPMFWGTPLAEAESQSRSRALPGACALRGARARAVCARCARQCARDRRRPRAGRARRKSLSRQGELPRARHRSHRGQHMSTRPSAGDWATDFDHLDPRWIENPYPIWQELRDKCPVAHTERFRGVYFPSRYEDVRAVAYDTENFSSRRIIVREAPPPRIPAPPITSDPPEHRPAKNLLLPAFTPDAIKRYEQHTRDICGKLIGRFAGKSGCDAAVDYAQEIPVRVIAVMLGLPEEEGDRFRTWIHEILEVGITRPDVLMKAIGETTKYFQAEVEKRRAAPRDDLISRLAAATIDDE